MGLIIEAIPPNPDEPGRPFGVKLTIECDEVEAFFCRGVAAFEGHSYAAARGEATSEGWLEQDDPRGRLWVCPACSGK